MWHKGVCVRCWYIASSSTRFRRRILTVRDVCFFLIHIYYIYFSRKVESKTMTNNCCVNDLCVYVYALMYARWELNNSTLLDTKYVLPEGTYSVYTIHLFTTRI